MGEEKQDLEFEITIKERTSWGLIHKTFSNTKIKVDKAQVIIEVIEYISENYRADYIRALKFLRGK